MTFCTKQRKSTTALKPSQLGDEFAYLDENNLFDSDDWYVGVGNIGVKKIDDLSLSVAKMSATVRLAKYTGYINKTDKAAATKLGGILLPKLEGLKADGEAWKARRRGASSESQSELARAEPPRVAGARAGRRAVPQR